jgi:hypothetical protein
MAFADEALLEAMKLQDESPDDPRHRRQAKVIYAKSEFTQDELAEKCGERVWVRCISELGPWADDKPMRFWKEYFIKIEEAIVLDEKRFAVILHSRESMKPQVKPANTLQLKKQGA